MGAAGKLLEFRGFTYDRSNDCVRLTVFTKIYSWRHGAWLVDDQTVRQLQARRSSSLPPHMVLGEFLAIVENDFLGALNRSMRLSRQRSIQSANKETWRENAA